MNESESVVVEEEAAAAEEEKGLKQRLLETERALERAMRLLENSQKYNADLRKQIESLSTELHGYRSAAQNRVDAECQVDVEDLLEACGEKPMPDWCVPNDTSQAPEGGVENGIVSSSIADSLKAAAEEVVWEQSGFVYDTTSGMYYDHNSGYYYDPASTLYYDPSSTAYFYYDQDEQTYKFHSYATGSHGDQTSETPGQGTGEAGASSQDNVASSQRTEKKSDGTREKSSHKERHKEKAKIRKGKVHKSRRRRKKSMKNRDRTKRGKIGRNSGGSSQESVDLTEGSDRQNRRKNSEEEEGGMECESDSLASGESEMETEPESGELTDSSLSSSMSSEDGSLDRCEENDVVDLNADPVCYDTSAWTEVESEASSANYPPCIRIITQASDSVAEGTFFLVTYPGGFIGRDGDTRNVVSLPDVNVSKVHAEIKYDDDRGYYTLQDCGSQNGTFVNDFRISQAKKKSGAVPLCHGDEVKVGGTHLLLHIHPGTDTCDACEPGQVLANLRAQRGVFNDHVVVTREEKKKQARQQLKEIKKKYGLENSAYVDNVAAIKNPDYADKAQLRRRYVGSEHQSHKRAHEAPASVHRPISTENKGHRMLARMGWKAGSGLGKDSAGRAEPVTVELRANQTAGLGASSSIGVSLDNVHAAHRMQRLAQTQARYHRLENPSPRCDASGSGRDSGKSARGGHCEGSGEGRLSNSGDSQDRATSTASATTAAVAATTAGGGAGSSKAAATKKIQIRWIQGQTQKGT